MIKFLRLVLFGVVLLLPAVSIAAEVSSIKNPLNANFSSIPEFIAGALQVMVKVSLPIIGLFILIAGFKFAAAGGNESKLSKAKENFVWVFIGAALILGAWVLATLISNTVTQIVGA
jgi:Type IV secretion system pilin